MAVGVLVAASVHVEPETVDEVEPELGVVPVGMDRSAGAVGEGKELAAAAVVPGGVVEDGAGLAIAVDEAADKVGLGSMAVAVEDNFVAAPENGTIGKIELDLMC